MNTRIVNEKDVTPELDQAVREGLCVCFPPDVPVFSHTRAWHGSGPAWSVIIEKEGVIEAHVGVIDRKIKAGDEPIHVAGIQNVFVIPKLRDTGLSKIIMDAAMAEADARGYDCGFLFCVPSLEPVYKASRWHLLPRERVVRVDEKGREVELPKKNIVMFYPLKRREFPPGSIHLGGNDW